MFCMKEEKFDEIKINTDMNTLFNNFRIKMYESGFAKCTSRWNTAECNSRVSSTYIKSYSHLYYITGGTGTLSYNNQTITLTPGNIYFIPPLLRHSRQCEYLEQLFFHVNIFTNAKADDEDIFKNCQRIITIPRENIDEMKDIYAGSRFSNFFNLYSMLMQDISKIISAYDFDMNSDMSYDTLTNRAILYVKEHLSGTLKISTIAKDLYVSQNKLSSTFYKDTDIHLNRYINEQLLFEIKSLLLDTDMTTSDIADKLQFCERSYFSKFFKKHFGCSPKQFRIAFKKKTHDK